jgi:uncharacterized protein (TIGR03435 family)
MKTLSADYICSMMAMLILLTLLLTAYSQNSTFDVASVKPSVLGPGGGISGGPGTKEPGRWTCQNVNLFRLIRDAFDLKPFQLEAPRWLNDRWFDIMAKVPEGATKQQFQQMQQNLLIERFGLKFRREKKEIDGYELVVAKNGPKFKESGSEPAKDSDSIPGAVRLLPPKFDKDGFPVIPPGKTQQIIMESRPEGGGMACGSWIRTPIEKIVTFISEQLRKPVRDNTDLKSKYDLSLGWWPDSLPLPGMESIEFPKLSRPDNVFTAVQEQLGLKLQPTKIMTEILIIDHVEKTPTEN